MNSNENGMRMKVEMRFKNGMEIQFLFKATMKIAFHLMFKTEIENKYYD